MIDVPSPPQPPRNPNRRLTIPKAQRSGYNPVYHQQQRRMSAALLAELTKPFHRKLLDEAKNSLKASQNDIAVVLSQAASEM